MIITEEWINAIFMMSVHMEKGKESGEIGVYRKGVAFACTTPDMLYMN